MKRFILALLISMAFSQSTFARRATADEQVRRLYLDLLNRLPNNDEYQKSKKIIEQGRYEALVNALMKEDEYFSNLAGKIVKHYAPVPEKRSHDFITYKRLEKHIQSKYLGKKNDFRNFIEDLVQAKGIAYANQMVLFYSADEDSADMAARFSARILGVPLLCSRCHDHKIHADIKVDDFWSLAAFFEGMNKKIISDKEGLAEIEKQFKSKYKTRSEIGKEEYKHVMEWIETEKAGKSVYSSLTAEETLGQNISNTLKDKPRRRNNDDDTSLKAPQLFIYESNKALSKLKIEYELDGEKFTSRASHFKRGRRINDKDLPRDVLTKWMARREPLYVARAVTNWTTNWLYGRGWVMPAYDTYNVTGKLADALNKHAHKFMTSQFNIHTLVKSLLMAPIYREKSLLANDEEKFAFFKARRLRHLSGEQLVNSLNSTEKVIRAKYDNQEALKKMYRTAVYKNKLVEKLFPTSLDDTEASYRGTLNQSLHLSTNQTFLNYTRKLAENSFYTYQDDGIDTFLKFIFNKFYTRNPTDNETAFFKAKLNFNKSYSESGAFETVWTLLNSPEMRLY